MYDPHDYDLTLDELPTWMRPRYRGIDWSFLAILLLCLVAAAPLIHSAGLPPSPQAERLMYRNLEVAEILQAGDLYSRWAPDFNYGYGSPLFNHLAPLPHYLGGLYIALTQDSGHMSVRVMLAVAIFILGISTMSFVRRRWGEFAGVLAGATALLSPFVLQIGPYLSVDVSGLWALALFMASLWALDRTLTQGRGRDLMLLALISTALLVTDISLSPVYFLTIVIWSVVTVLADWPHNKWLAGATGLILGLGMASFFYLPAMIEHDAVRWERLPVYPDQYSTGRLFGAVPQFDRAAFNPQPIPYLGIASWLLALTGSIWILVSLVIPRRKLALEASPNHYRLQALVFVPLVGVLVIAMLNPTAEIWNNTDQFEALRPDDLLGPLSGGCAILAGQTGVLIETLLRSAGRRILATGFLTLILGASAANLFYTPNFVPVQEPISLNQHLYDEVRGYSLGTIAEGHLLPADVETLPQPSRALFQGTGDLDRIDKIDRQSLPPSASVISIVSHDTARDEFTLESYTTGKATIFTFNYPGWQAQRGDQSLSIATKQPEGFIQIPVTEGVNEIRLRFDNTDIRDLALGVAGGSLLVLLVTVFWLERRANPIAPGTMTLAELRLKRDRQVRSSGLVLAIACLSIVLRLNPDYVTRETAEGNIPAGVVVVDQIIQGDLRGSISLLGYRFDSTVANPGERIGITTYWSAESTNLDSFQIAISILDNGRVLWQQQYRHIANWPTKRWPQEGYIVSVYQLPAPTSPGEYQIMLELGPCDRTDLRPCENLSRSDVYDIRSGAIRKEIVLPQTISVQ